MGRPNSLASLEAAEIAAEKSARKPLPKSWKDGLLDLLEEQERGQSDLLNRKSGDYDLNDICRRIRALRILASVIRSTEIEVPGQSSRLAAYTETGHPAEELAAVMVPPGWRETSGKLLEQTMDTARETGINAPTMEERLNAFSLMHEAQQLMTCLSEIEANAARARQDAHRATFTERRVA